MYSMLIQLSESTLSDETLRNIFPPTPFSGKKHPSSTANENELTELKMLQRIGSPFDFLGELTATISRLMPTKTPPRTKAV